MSIEKKEGCLNSVTKVFAGISCFIGIMMFIIASTVNEDGIYGAGATFLVIGIILFLISKTAVNKALNHPTIKNAGVYLTADQIERLEKAQDIPIVQTPVVLKPGELAIFYCEATKQETKNRVVGRTGGYGGASIRLAKGLSIHTGKTASRPIYGDVHSHFHGKFVMTTHRFVFLNGQKGFDISYDKISSFQHHLDSISIQSKSTTHLLLLPRPDLINALFTTIQTTGVAEFAAMMNKCYIQGDRYSLEVKYHCSCGAEVKRDMKFCPGCGDSLEFPEDPEVKIKDGKVLLEGANYEDRLKDNSLKIELPDSLQMNSPVDELSTPEETTGVPETISTPPPVINTPMTKPKKRIFMIIGACFFGFYSALFFIGSFGPNLTGTLGPATATGILAFMFIMLARSPKTETHIGKIYKPAFVILCLIAILLSGIIITRLTNQTPSQSQNQSSLVNEQSDNTQSNSSVQDNAKSIIDTKSEVPAEKQTQTTEYSQKRPISKYDNLSFGIPAPADTIIDRPGYALGYIEKHEQPAWVIYRMTADEATTKAAKRGDDFRPDPQIPTGSATLADYRSSGYDRGHLAPAADMAFSAQTMSDSFYMSNMSPQKPAFNRGVWMNLEAQIRQFAISEKDIYVVTGPIFPKDKTITVGSNAVTVPPAYYKVVYDLTPPQKMIGFIVPHEGSKASLSSFAVTVDAVEDATGLNFFSTLSEDQQAALEGTITIDAWDWSRFKNSGYTKKSSGGRSGEQRFADATGKYWISSSGLRHNSSCTYFRNSNGQSTDDPDAGKRDCKRCGGALR